MLINGMSINNATNRAFEEDGKDYPTFATMKEFAQTCRKALEEIQQYRAIGLTPELIEAMQGHNIALINDLGEYQKIGTIDEFKALKEKSVAKKPIDGGEVLREVCPTCGRFISEMNSPWYCPCGQKLDWSE